LLLLQARGRVTGKTGVWIGDRKIGAVGVRITHGISSHGVALNVNTDLSWYSHIVPCGTPDKEVTSIAQELMVGRSRATGGEALERHQQVSSGKLNSSSYQERDSSSSKGEQASGASKHSGMEDMAQKGLLTTGQWLSSAGDGGGGEAGGLLKRWQVEDSAATPSNGSSRSSLGGRDHPPAPAAGAAAGQLAASPALGQAQGQRWAVELSGGVPSVSFDVVRGQLVDSLVRGFGWRDCEEVGLQQLLREVQPQLEQEQQKGVNERQGVAALLDFLSVEERR
jgi:hypothetical protein